MYIHEFGCEFGHWVFGESWHTVNPPSTVLKAGYISGVRIILCMVCLVWVGDVGFLSKLF